MHFIARLNAHAVLVACSTFALAGSALSQGSSVVSREVSYFAIPPEPAQGRSVVSREVSYFAIPPEEAEGRSIVSREVSYQTTRADLVVASILSSGPNQTALTATITWTVTNQGSEPAIGTWSDRLYRSPDAILGNGNDILIVSKPRPNDLAPGASYSNTSPITWPASAGTHYLIVRADADSQILEFPLENNNTRSEPFVLTYSALPDLSVQFSSPPTGTLLSGSTVTIGWSVTNTGPVATSTSAWYDGLFLTTNSGGALPTDAISLATLANLYGLNPGQGYPRSASVTLPNDFTGTRYIAVKADTYGGVLEQSEANNLLYSGPLTIVLEPQPDIVPIDLDVGLAPPITVFSGQGLTVTWKDRNQGNGITNVASWTDRVYLSTNSNAGSITGDLLLGSASLPTGFLPPGQDRARTLTATIPTNVSGTRWVKVYADANNELSEFAAETNNVAVMVNSISVVTGGTPDLQPTAISIAATGTLQRAQSYPVTWSVTSPDPAWDDGFSWSDSIYLSTNATFEPAVDVLVRSAYQSAARSGTAWTGLDYTKTTSITIPTTVVLGTWYALVVVDSGDQVYELNGEGNNVRASVPFVIGSDGPDLVASAPVVPSALPAGQPFEFSFTVTNGGSTATPGGYWTDAVYLSDDVILQLGLDQPVGQVVRQGTLGVGGTYTASGTGALPPAIAADRFLIFQADNSGYVYEGSNEANNFVVVPVTVLPPGANLVATTLSTPAKAQAGTPIAVAWTVQNDGTLPTYLTYWTDRIYLSANAALDGSDMLLGSKTHSGRLQSGAQYSDAAAFGVPFTVAGAWYVLVVTDAGGSEPETSESDNVRATRMVLEVGPGVPSDLRITDISAPTSATAGQYVTVSWTQTNAGPGAASAPWSDAVYLSIDPTFSAGADRYLGSVASPGALAEGESRVVQGTFYVPIGTSGPHHVAVVADVSQDVDTESDETNNVLITASPVTVVIPNACNLSPTQVVVPATGLVGSTIAVSWTTANLNGGPASGTWSYDLFLSADDTLDSSDREIATVTSTAGTVPVGGTHTQSAMLPVPGVAPGTYHVIVLADSRNNLLESSEGDNLGASVATVALDVLEILPGQSSTLAMPTASSRYWRITSAQDLTLRVTLEHSTASAWTELYLREGAVPAPGQADVSFQQPGAASQVLLYPLTHGQPIYVLARTTYGVGRTNQNATLSIEVVPFEVASVVPSRIGTGVATIAIQGSQLNVLNAVHLERSGGGATVLASEFATLDASRALAAFDLSSAPTGAYDLVIGSSTGGFDTLANAVTVEQATSETLRVGLSVSPSVRKGSSGAAVARLENIGNVNVPRGVLVFGRGIDPAFSMTSATLELTGLATDGVRESLLLLVDDLGPGQSEEVEIDFHVGATFLGDRLTFGLAGRPLSSADESSFTIDVASELLRQAVVADQASNAGLLVRAQDLAAWRASVLANLVVPTTDIHLPATLPITGGNLLARIAEAAAFGLPAVDQVPTTAIGAAEGQLGCHAFDGTGFACTNLAPASTGSELSTAAVTSVRGVVPSATLLSGLTPFSNDPNDKTGPTGTGTQNMVSSGGSMEYRVRFENVPSASAPAAFVVVEDEFEPALDVSTFRATRIVIGSTVIELPANSITYQGQINLSATLGVILQVTAGVNAETRKAFWILQSRDPITGLPVTDGIRGILPPNDASGAGQGYVVFTMKPDPDVNFIITGQGVRNTARIRFDANATIPTNFVAHTFDADAPTSSVTIGSSIGPGGPLNLQWAGQDPVGGAGVATYTVYCSIDEAPYTPILADTIQMSLSYPTEFGHEYRFYVLATDLTGNVEPTPAVPDVVFETPSDCNGNGIGDPTDLANGAPDVYGPMGCTPDAVLDACQPEADCDLDGVPDRCEIAAGALDTNGDSVPDECQNPTFPVSCAGDGTSTQCPCGNNGAPGHGCGSSLYASGALLVGGGIPSVSADTMRLDATNMSQSATFFIQGTGVAGGGGGTAFGDGIRCVGGTVIRLGALFAPGGAAAYPAAGSASISVRGLVPVAGGVTRHYSVWYRNAADFCTSATFNWTNEVSANWVP